MWNSKYKYTTKHGVGKITEIGAGYIQTVAGRKFRIPADEAKKIQSAEENLKVGRPKLFPLIESETHGIMLPIDLWRKIGKPYSQRIEELLCEFKK